MSILRNALWNTLCLVGICLSLGCSSPKEDSSPSQGILKSGDEEIMPPEKAGAMASVPDVEPADDIQLNDQLFLAMDIREKNQRMRRLEELLKSGASPNAVESQPAFGTGMSILSLAALRGGCDEILLLLDHGADLDAEDSVGGTALMSCFAIADELRDKDSSSGFLKHKCVMELLIERGADTNHKTHLGDTPLSIALRNNNIEAALVLLEHGADPDLSIITEFVGNARSGKILSAREFVEKRGSKEMRELFARFPPKQN
jgi:ankyrin repeat protein